MTCSVTAWASSYRFNIFNSFLEPTITPISTTSVPGITYASLRFFAFKCTDFMVFTTKTYWTSKIIARKICIQENFKLAMTCVLIYRLLKANLRFSSDKTDDRYILLKTYYHIFSPFEISETLPHAPISRFRFSISCSYFFNCSSAFRSSFMISALKLNVILALSINLYRSTGWLNHSSDWLIAGIRATG